MAPIRRSQVAVEDVPRRKQYDIPYFAHQQLEPARFPADLGLPVGGPPSANLNQTRATTAKDWNDTDSDGTSMADEASSEEHLSGDDGKRKRNSVTPLEGRASKRSKGGNGRPAMSKRVTADLDSDDEIIVRMKNAKYQEKDIAKRLADEGRMFYNIKTIGSRWGRLRKVLQARQDELLDANLTDWHEGDDDVLKEAIKKADEVVEKAIQEAQDRKWRLVADNMKVIKPVTNFSKNACEKRFLELQAGTAKPTPESILNPSPAVQARIDARRERERKIEDDKQKMSDSSKANMEGNAWHSKPRPLTGR